MREILQVRANSMSRFPLLFVSLCLIGMLMAFGPVARGQTTEKVLHGFAGNSNRAVSSLVRDSAGNLYGTTQVGGSGVRGRFSRWIRRARKPFCTTSRKTRPALTAASAWAALLGTPRGTSTGLLRRGAANNFNDA